MTETEKPNAKVIGEDGNVYITLGISCRALKRAGLQGKADELKKRIIEDEEPQSYGEALNIMQEYVNFVGSDDDDDEDW